MWPILADLCSPGPVLPNLRSLEIDFTIFDRNEYLLPLLSPSLKTLLIDCVMPPKHNTISTLLNLAKIRGCNLEEFTYFKYPANTVCEAIMCFKTLQVVSLPLSETAQPKVFVTITQILSSLPSLRSLTCHIGAFAPLAIDEDQLCHTNLQRIAIGSSQGALREFFRMCIFPAVTNMKIVFNEVLSMEGIKSSFPNMRNLALTPAFMHMSGQLLEFKHVASLLSLPIQSFTLTVWEHALTPSDLCRFAQSWPNLRFLEIFSDTEFDPLPALTAFVNHQRLECLDLCLPLEFLLDLVSNMQNLIRTNAVARGGSGSSLRSLCLCCNAGEITASKEDQHALVEFLLRLFPNLMNLKFKHPRSSSSRLTAPEFQETLMTMKQGFEDIVGSNMA